MTYPELERKLDELEQRHYALSQRVTALEGRKPRKPLAISEDLNTPCTAALEVKLQKLAKDFGDAEIECLELVETNKVLAASCERDDKDKLINEHSYYFFLGKVRVYAEAAEKITKLLVAQYGGYAERWIVERYSEIDRVWSQSLTYPNTYDSKKVAESLFADRDPLLYRAFRVS